MKRTDEKIEWHEDGTATLNVTEEDEVRNDKGEVVGTTQKGWSIKTTKEELEAGIENIRTTISNLERRREDAVRNRSRLGEAVKLTPELERLQRQLQKIGLQQEQEKYDNEAKSIERDLEIQKTLLSKRQASLIRKPKEETVR